MIMRQARQRRPSAACGLTQTRSGGGTAMLIPSAHNSSTNEQYFRSLCWFPPEKRTPTSREREREGEAGAMRVRCENATVWPGGQWHSLPIGLACAASGGLIKRGVPRPTRETSEGHSLLLTMNVEGIRVRRGEDCSYRAEKKSWYVVARNFFLLLLNCSAWPCLGPA